MIHLFATYALLLFNHFVGNCLVNTALKVHYNMMTIGGGREENNNDITALI